MSKIIILQNYRKYETSAVTDICDLEIILLERHANYDEVEVEAGELTTFHDTNLPHVLNGRWKFSGHQTLTSMELSKFDDVWSSLVILEDSIVSRQKAERLADLKQKREKIDKEILELERPF